MTATRRQLLVRGAGAASAAVLPAALLAAPPAFAKEGAETDELTLLIELEQGSSLAYETALESKDLGSEATKLLEQLHGHEAAHTTALSAAIDQLTVDPPEASSDPADYEQLDGLDAAKTEKELLDFLISLEEELVKAYLDAALALESPDVIRTGAQVGSSHVQQLVALRLLGGEASAAATQLPGPTGVK